MNQSDFVDDPVGHGASGLCKLHRWTSLSASELPIPEDAWIRSVVSIDAGERWSQWLALPRYRVCRDFLQWAVVVVAFAESHDGGALMSLFSGNLIPFRAAAFAVSRSDGQLYRLTRNPQP